MSPQKSKLRRHLDRKIGPVQILPFFQMYDKDGSGTVDMSEMIEVLETVYIMEGVFGGDMAKTRAKQIFDELDANGDGSLTCEEFIAGCMKDEEMVNMLTKNCSSEENSKSG